MAEALIRLMERKFELGGSDIQQIHAVRDLTTLQAALDETMEPESSLESVLEKLQ